MQFQMSDGYINNLIFITIIMNSLPLWWWPWGRRPPMDWPRHWLQWLWLPHGNKGGM